MRTGYLAITNNGFENALQASNPTGATVWCGAGVLSEGEFESHTGVAVSRFTYSIDDGDGLQGAVDTIREHHPSAVICVEAHT